MSLPKPAFKVLLFGPDIHPGGVKAKAYFEEGILVVQAKRHWFTVPLVQIRLSTGGYDGRQWLISWMTPNGKASVMLKGEAAVADFIRLAPPEIAEELRRAHRAHTRTGLGFRIAMVLIGFVLAMPLVALALFWINGDRISQWAADRISLEQEIRLGELAFEQMRPSLKLIEQGAAREAIDRIGVRLTAGTPYRFRFYLADDPRINAFALPGGVVVVYSGLLAAADNADEVAGVLAHETSHVLRRHSLRNMIHGLGWSAVVAVALGDLSGGVWNNMARELGQLSYGRELELQADEDGVALLRTTGVPADGMVKFFEKLTRREDGGIALLSTHPAGKERLAALRETILKQGAYFSQPIDIDWQAVRQDLAPVVK